MREDPKVDRLAAQPLLRGLSRRELSKLAPLFDELTLPAGTILMREGGTGGEAFLIRDGSVVVTTGGDEIATLGPGEVIGELALFDGGPRSATVRAISDLSLFVLTPVAFTTLASEPAVARRLLVTTAARLRVADVAR
jgi:CRP-like cAMP-binding protein